MKRHNRFGGLRKTGLGSFYGNTSPTPLQQELGRVNPRNSQMHMDRLQRLNDDDLISNYREYEDTQVENDLMRLIIAELDRRGIE